jgi:hypothetical protein
MKKRKRGQTDLLDFLREESSEDFNSWPLEEELRFFKDKISEKALVWYFEQEGTLEQLYLLDELNDLWIIEEEYKKAHPYMWNIKHCQKNCRRYRKCDKITSYYFSWDELKSSQQLVQLKLSETMKLPNLQEKRQKFIQAKEACVKCYKQGWIILKKQGQSWLKSLKYDH